MKTAFLLVLAGFLESGAGVRLVAYRGGALVPRDTPEVAEARHKHEDAVAEALEFHTAALQEARASGEDEESKLDRSSLDNGYGGLGGYGRRPRTGYGRNGYGRNTFGLLGYNQPGDIEEPRQFWDRLGGHGLRKGYRDEEAEERQYSGNRGVHSLRKGKGYSNAEVLELHEAALQEARANAEDEFEDEESNLDSSRGLDYGRSLGNGYGGLGGYGRRPRTGYGRMGYGRHTFGLLGYNQPGDIDQHRLFSGRKGGHRLRKGYSDEEAEERQIWGRKGGHGLRKGYSDEEAEERQIWGRKGGHGLRKGKGYSDEEAEERQTVDPEIICLRNPRCRLRL
jgi:hypothetical protein